MTTALLVIDVQRALCSGQWAMFDIDRVIARINSVIAQARAAGAPVVLVQHEEAEGPLQVGAEGWQLDERLAVLPTDPRIRKTASDAFHRTALHALLQSEGVDRVVACGLQSEFCVDSTVRGALAHGYPVVLVADGHSTLDNGVLSATQITAHHNATLSHLDSYGPRVTLRTASEVCIGV
ncbi:cysteine hydrolase family protein [Sphaerotilaceae bacterium SBD11-9]